MKKRMLSTISILSICALLLVGCGKKGELESKDNANNKTLNVQFVPTNNDGSMEAKAKPFAEYLSKKLGVPVNVTLATDYSTIVEAMASKKIDIGIMPPAAYVQARDQHAAEALLTSQLGAFNRETGLPENGKLTGTFKGEILVRSDSPIKSIQDLKGKRIATLSPNSASGYIYPIAEMKDLGINPIKDCTLTTVNDIPSEMTAVLNGQQDACFVFEGARNVFAKKFPNENIMKDLRVLYLTNGDIPNDAIAVQPDMNNDLKQKIKEVFLNMSNDKEGKEAMSLWGHMGYENAIDKNYDVIRNYTEKASK